MKLHWSPRSPYVRKVMVCAHELGLVDRLDLVRSVAAMRTPNEALMRDNPLSKIPTLVLDSGAVLFDSAVICEYLNDLACGPLFPRQGEERWSALRWHALGDGLLDALILWRNERERAMPLRELLTAFERKMEATLDALDGEAEALALASFAIGHVALGCALGYLDYRFGGFDWRARAPRLSAWYAMLCERPSFARTVPVDG